MVRRASAFFACVAVAAIWAMAHAFGIEPKTHASAENGLVVEHAEIILAPSGAGMMAGYVTVWNGTQQQADLASVESAAFGSVSLHRTEIVDGVAKMRPINEGLRIPGRSELLMKPGGIHMMVEDPQIDLSPGDAVNLSLSFRDGTTVSATALLRPVGTRPTDHHHGEDDTQ
ncbi:copper chaperone PCu(A)C [Mesorhizobium delmotii]|uniref:Copper chaperone PCu(A)C n=1 Tax=Mesorhizobium delmotii TaxID=1631247 RepID=A0A2P9ARD4_9HYPH|nr:copper chaperone PCu(A)C [Mesorhizobium delmotii]SJM33704.1 conserved exported hypothetical protein [Mesorhizobium delmotii]